MERLKHLKNTLMCCVEGQMGHLDTVNTHELGAAIDMLKDLEEAIYYCTITEAMKEQDGEEKHHRSREHDELYYTEPYYLDKKYPYVNGNGHWDMNGNEDEHKSGNGYENGNGKEGRSGRSRRQYMESKEMHHDSAKQMRELEKYVKELSDDILEMIEEASPEERQFLGKKIAALATKVEAID